VYLAAIAQRTRRLRFGPLVYALALHHPLRVLEEICILDQMSGGRFELGSPNLDGGIKFAMVADREGEDVFNLLSSYIEPRKDALVAVLEAHVS
jgi:hypothetical protein